MFLRISLDRLTSLAGRLAACGSAVAALTTHPKPEGLDRCADSLNCAKLNEIQIPGASSDSLNEKSQSSHFLARARHVNSQNMSKH